LWPAFFVGTLFGFIINCLLDPEIASLKDALIYLGSMVYVFAGVETSGITGNVGVLNGATWYISSIFVTALPLYYLIWKNEKAFKGWIAPFIFLIVWGYFGLAGEPINPFAKNVLSYGFFETSWLVAFATFCFGAMLWYPIERLKNKELTGFQQGLVNIVAILIVAALLKAVVVRGYYRDETVVMFFMAIFIVFMLSGKDCISKVLGKVSFFGKLGKFSLYLYVMHFPLCRAFPVYYEVTAANYYTSLAMFVLVLFVFAFIGMFVTEKLLRPFLGAIIGKKETQAA
jgi:peptidoglycan/LPS O-acetylase OafA/YrhL